ncbi:uncharacterized protein [Hetaerina americana]|uniref:uncharacterized protein n=1 Tax=Hetaerina americana TaxID=62018 RepID=UPI003A7F5E18
MKQPRIRNGFTSPFGLYRTSSPNRFSELALRPSPQPHQVSAPIQQQQLQQQQPLLDYATSDTLRALHRLDPLELVARVESKRSRLRATRERQEREEGQAAESTGTGTIGAVMLGTEPGGRVVVMGVGEEWRSSPTIGRIAATSGSGTMSEENRTPLPE